MSSASVRSLLSQPKYRLITNFQPSQFIENLSAADALISRLHTQGYLEGITLNSRAAWIKRFLIRFNYRLSYLWVNPSSFILACNLWWKLCSVNSWKFGGRSFVNLFRTIPEISNHAYKIIASSFTFIFNEIFYLLRISRYSDSLQSTNFRSVVLIAIHCW